MNAIKTAFFMTLLTLLFLFVGQTLGGTQGMRWAFLIAIGMNLFSYWFSDKIVLKMYGGKEVSEREAPNLYAIVRTLTNKAQLPMPKVYVIENPTPNAFATGRNPKHAAVAVTTGILNLLSTEELTGVIAHELSHIRNRDILIGTIAATFAGAITMLIDMARWTMFLGGGSSDDDRPHPAFFLLMTILGPIAAMLIQMAVSRSREYQADEGGARLCGNPRWLARALVKLEKGAETMPMDAKPATAHMFIVNPLRGGGFVNLFRTHPSTEDRVRRLEALIL